MIKGEDKVQRKEIYLFVSLCQIECAFLGFLWGFVSNGAACSFRPLIKDWRLGQKGIDMKVKMRIKYQNKER
jgi:hypothetical protein